MQIDYDQQDNDTIMVWCFGAATAFLLLVLFIYIINWQRNGIKIMKILFILLANELFSAIFQTLSYINSEDNALCIVSMIGQLFFKIATQFWIIFITKLIYQQALAPGKFFNLMNFFFRNIALTYVPSLILSTFLLIILLMSDGKNQKQCWKALIEKDPLDSIVYFTSFIVPNTLGILIVTGYLYYFNKFVKKKWTKFLLFPIFSIVFGIYYLTIKIYFFIEAGAQNSYLELPFALQSFSYGALFLYIAYIYNRSQKLASSDLTIRDSEIQASFIQDL